MKAAIIKFTIHPFRIATGKEKIAVLQFAIDENAVFKDETLIIQSLSLIYLYFAVHALPAGFGVDA